MSGSSSIKELQKRLFENNSTYVIPNDVSKKLFGNDRKTKINKNNVLKNSQVQVTGEKEIKINQESENYNKNRKSATKGSEHFSGSPTQNNHLKQESSISHSSIFTSSNSRHTSGSRLSHTSGVHSGNETSPNVNVVKSSKSQIVNNKNDGGNQKEELQPKMSLAERMKRLKEAQEMDADTSRVVRPYSPASPDTPITKNLVRKKLTIHKNEINNSGQESIEQINHKDQQISESASKTSKEDDIEMKTEQKSSKITKSSFETSIITTSSLQSLSISDDSQIDDSNSLSTSASLPKIKLNAHQNFASNQTPTKSKTTYHPTTAKKISNKNRPTNLNFEQNRKRNNIFSSNESILSDLRSEDEAVSILSDMHDSEYEFYDSGDEGLTCLIWDLPSSDEEMEVDAYIFSR